MASLDITTLTKQFGRTKALDSVSLAVRDGEFMVVLGPTGAGKTTLLRCVAGLEKPEAGQIHMDGDLINGLTPAERDVAFVFQSYALYPRKTVYENMAFPLQARRMDSENIRERVTAVSRLLAIDGLLQRRPAELSGGQQQRVALGRAMVRQPRLFLMDEPLTNLDFMLRVEMRGELKRLQNELAATFFYVTNDQVEAMSMADRIAILNHGVLQQVDTPENIYNYPANMFVAAFVGNPRMNFLECRVDVGQRMLVGMEGAWHLSLPESMASAVAGLPTGTTYVMGIRPEDVSMDAESDLTAEIYVIEPLGDRTILDLRVGHEMVKMKVSADFMGAGGQRMGIRFDPARVHLFEQGDGRTIF